MQTVPKLEVQGTPLSRQTRDLVWAQLKRLESRFGKITACRIVIRPPGEHHRLGAPYAVSLHLCLPGGREVNVGLTSRSVDRRYGDLSFAIHDSFRKAVRQMQRQVSCLADPARRKRGAPKQEE